MGRTARTIVSVLLAVASWTAPAFGTTGPPIAVHLGVHRFGDLSEPEAIVARAPASAVGFEDPAEGPANGPWSFDVAADGSVWLLDQFDDRLLVWRAGRPNHVARTVAMPSQVKVAADIALGPDGTIYLSYLPSHPPDERKRLQVLAMDPAGHVRWTTNTDIELFNSVLRVVDGLLYWAPGPGTDGWTQLTGSSGAPLSPAQQRTSTMTSQPVGDGRSLDETGVSQHETRVSLLDDVGAVRLWWSVTSATPTYANGATAGIVDGDPVVPLIAQRTSAPDTKPRTEYVVVRLAADGTVPAQLALDYEATFGDPPITPLRIGPDGALYQLRSDPASGVSIARYALGAARPTPDPTPTAIPGSATPDPPPSGGVSPAWWIVAGVVGVAGLAWWSRHRSRRGRHRAA